jgi:hypothetical protein
VADKSKNPPRKQVTLPVAPDGWEYEVALKRGDDTLHVAQDGTVTASIDGEPPQETKEADLGAGVRAATTAARTLTQIENQRKALEDAQSKGIFGGKAAPATPDKKPDAVPVPDDDPAQPALA